MSPTSPTDSKTTTLRDWVLIVDNDTLVRNVVERMLEKTGLEVVGAETASQAFELLLQRPQEPVVIMVEVLMPGMDGLTLTRKLSKRLEKSTLIFLSGHTSNFSWLPPDLREIPFVSKPFTEAVITKIVAAAHAGYHRKS
jgi:two-component system, cell cycle sensor histidine kinase and response regulator CckA